MKKINLNWLINRLAIIKLKRIPTVTIELYEDAHARKVSVSSITVIVSSLVWSAVLTAHVLTVQTLKEAPRGLRLGRLSLQKQFKFHQLSSRVVSARNLLVKKTTVNAIRLNFPALINVFALVAKT